MLVKGAPGRLLINGIRTFHNATMPNGNNLSQYLFSDMLKPRKHHDCGMARTVM